MLKGLIQNLKKDKSELSTTPHKPVVIARSDHNISRNLISPNALKVLYRLHNAGFTAFLVGGCVRDLLLGRRPKDFDIATNALPEEVRKLFRNCRLIGKRFRLAHIVFGKEIIEVATFRTHHKNAQETHGHSREGMIIRDNVYGTIEDDAWRRDFSINALYYSIADFSILDYTGGMDDLAVTTLRMIGDPLQRFQEDPVRLLRAIRFVGKLKLSISPDTEKHMLELSHLLGNVSPARLFQEVLKFFQEGATYATFQLMQKYHLFAHLFPQTSYALKHVPEAEKLLQVALENTDERLQAGKTVSPAFLFAVFVWHPVFLHVKKAPEDLPPHVAYEKAIKTVLRQQTETLTIPKRLLISIQDICFLQHRLTCRYGSAPVRLLDHPRFRAAYDLLLLRAASGENIQELSSWWVKFYDATPEDRDELIKQVPNTGAPRPAHRKKRRFKKPRGQKKPASSVKIIE